MKKALLLFATALTVGWAFWPRPVLTHEKVKTTVSFDREIVRILNKRCIACHTENNLSVPFTSYEKTRPWARAIEDEVLRRHMPPWRAISGYGKFVNDNGMTNRELQFLVAWIEGNGPKTKDQTLIVNLDQMGGEDDERLKVDFEKWQLGKADLLAPIAVNTIAPGQGDEVRRVIVDLKLTSDRRVRALEFKPGDRRVVRAAYFSVQETGQWLGSWTPWYGVTTLPKDTAFVVPAGSHIVAEIHSRSTDVPVDERGTLGLYFAPGSAAYSPTDLVVEAKREATTSNQRLQRFSGSVTLAGDASVFAFKPEVQPGLHSYEVSAKKPDGTVQVLLLVRDVLPAWPTPYILEEPMMLTKGTEVSFVAYYGTGGAVQVPADVKLTMSNIPRAVVTTQ